MRPRSLALTLAASFLLGLAVNAVAAIEAKEVVYQADGVEMKGYLAKPAADGQKRPGVLVVHEWWGLNDYARGRARMLAELGYPALAVDMYGGGRVAEHPKEAGEMSSAARKDPEGATRRFEAALNLLKAEAGVDPDRIAAIGYCFGGGVALEMARRNEPLRGVVSFHGALTPIAAPAKGPVVPKVLVLHGAADPMAPAEAVAAFQKEMTDAGADWSLTLYGGAKHSFTSPEADKRGIPGIAYNADADRRSWEAMQAFLREVLQR